MLVLQPKYGEDYSTGINQTFLLVFGVLFNGVTGIMGELNTSNVGDPM